MNLHLIIEPGRTSYRSPIAFALYRGLSRIARRSATQCYWTEPEDSADPATWSFLRLASAAEIAAYLGRGKAMPFDQVFDDLVLDVPAALDPLSLNSFAEAASVVIACGPTPEAETSAAALWSACATAPSRTGRRPVVLVASYAGQPEVTQRRDRVARLLSLAGTASAGSGALLDEPGSWLEPAPTNDGPGRGVRIDACLDKAARKLAEDLLSRLPPR